MVLGIRLCNWCHAEFAAVAVNAALAFDYPRVTWKPVASGVQAQLDLVALTGARP